MRLDLDGSFEHLLLTTGAGTGAGGTGTTPLKLPQVADSTPVRPGNNNNNNNNPSNGDGADGASNINNNKQTTRVDARDDLLRTGTVGIQGIATAGGALAGRTGATAEALRTPPKSTAAGAGADGISSTALSNQITPERNNSGAQVLFLYCFRLSIAIVQF